MTWAKIGIFYGTGRKEKEGEMVLVFSVQMKWNRNGYEDKH